MNLRNQVLKTLTAAMLGMVLVAFGGEVFAQEMGSGDSMGSADSMESGWSDPAAEGLHGGPVASVYLGEPCTDMVCRVKEGLLIRCSPAQPWLCSEFDSPLVFLYGRPEQ